MLRSERSITAYLALFAAIAVAVCGQSPHIAQADHGGSVGKSDGVGKNAGTAGMANSVTLDFPKKTSLGKLWSCSKDWHALGDCPDRFGGETKLYTLIGDAKGQLTLPRNAILRYKPSPEVMANVDLAKAMPREMIQFLDLSGMEFDKTAADIFVYFPYARRIDLGNAELDDELFSRMQFPQTVESINLDEIAMVGTTLKNLAKLRRLKNLELAKAYLQPAGFEQLASIESLTRLDISKTRVTNDQLAFIISKLPKLEMLGLKTCTKLTPACVKAIVSSPNLWMVDVVDTAITPKMIADAQNPHHKIKMIIGGVSDREFTVREAEKIFHPLK
ncbi:MAG TPA: hypothetical protein V6C97_28980 [Oculatellaceae cyanobacterium]